MFTTMLTIAGGIILAAFALLIVFVILESMNQNYTRMTAKEEQAIWDIQRKRDQENFDKLYPNYWDKK